MAGSYLKQLQLAKQLEEKTKEAQKNRELAEKENAELDTFLMECKECDVSLEEVDRAKRDFEAAMAAKEYQAALAAVKKGREEATNAYMRKIGEVGDSVESLLTLISSAGNESKTARELLERSKERALGDDLNGAMKLAKDAYDAAERTVHEVFSQLFSQAQETIMQAKDVGVDVSVFDDGLSRAKSSLEAQEYDACMSQIKEVLEGAGEDLRSQVDSVISRADELMSAGADMEADMSRVKSYSEKATAALTSMKFKEALSYAKKAEAEGETAISSKFQERAREVRESIKKAKSAKEDVSVPQQLLDQAQTALKEKKYIEALHALNSAHERVHKVEFDTVLEVISKARDRFVLAKKVGVDMTKSIMLLNTSRDSLKLGKFEEAIKYAEQSRKEVDFALEMFYKARDQVVELAKGVKFASDLGADMTGAKNFLTDARKYFEDHDYTRTVEACKQGLADVKKLSYDRTMESVNVADKAVKLGKEIGADVTEAEGLLQRAMDSLGKEDMLEAVNLANASKEAADAAMTRLMSDKIQSIDQFVKGYTGGEGLSDLSETITQARQHVASFEFDKAFSLVKQVTHNIESIGQSECDKVIGIARSKIADVKSMDGEAADLEILLKRANEALSRRIFEDATARAREVIDHADEQMNKLLQTELSSVKDSLEEARTIGIDIEPAKSMLKNARARTDEGDFKGAFSLIRETKSDLSIQIAKFDSIKSKIRKTEELISEAGRAKTDIAPLLRKLELAKSAFSNGDIDQAESIVDEATRDTEKTLGMYLAAKFILSSKESIDLAQANRIDAEEPLALLNKAKEMMKVKNYDEALANAKQCDELARKLLASAIIEMIRDLQRLLTDARHVGVDTVGPEKLAEKAQGLARSGEYAEALKCISSAKEDINHVKNLSSQAALEIRVARNSLKDAETLDMDVGKAREMLEQAVEALTRHQYAIALELARKSSEASSEVSKTRIWGTLGKFKERVDKAASEGVHVGTAESCVIDGIKAFKEGRYQDSLKLAMKCEMEMERAELQRDISTRAVDLSRKKLADASAEGIKSERITELVWRAESFLKEGKYVDAMTAAIESGDELHLIRENLDNARVELSATRERVERLNKINIDAREAEEMLEMAQEFLSDHEFAKAREAIARSSAKAEEIFESSINEVMSQNRQMITRAKQMGINTKSCEDLLEVANTSFSEKLWDFAYQQAMACRESCLQVISKKISNLGEEIRARTEGLQKLGASVKIIDDMVADAKSAAEGGDIAAAFQTLMNADAKIGTLEESHRKYMDISIAAESAMEALARFGMSKREPERLIAMADIEREKDYDSAIELVAEALDTAKELMESYSPELGGSISSLGLQEGVEGQLTVIVKNTGKAVAKDVSVQITGDFDATDTPGIPLLKPGSEVPVEFKVLPTKSGSVPIRLTIASKRHYDGRMQTFELEDTVNVFEAGPAFKLGRASDTTRCISCQGRIKPGFDIVTCRCGGQLHLSCAKRTSQCPVCGQRYEF